MRILVTAAAGQVGRATVDLLAGSHHDLLALPRAELDLADRERVEQVVAVFRPDAVVNCAAMTNVDACELDPVAAYAANAMGVRHLAVASERVGAHLVHVSTDYVFDGEAGRPYHEWDAVNPISDYGRSKLGGEHELERHAGSWAVARTSWVFGNRGGDFVSWVLGAYGRGELRGLVDDQTGGPTYAPDLAGVLVQLAVERRQGVFHVANAGECTRHGFGVAALGARGRDASGLARLATSDLPRPARRPVYSVLDGLGLRLAGIGPLRDWREALAHYLEGFDE
ncbi:MAG: dTDP-4-dehydrorhamnose reductase [Acidimicrobiia bacterium]